MDIDVALAALKFLAILTAGILSVIGVIVDYKKDGKITTWGRRAIIGIIISTVVAVLTQSIESYKQEIENAATLREIRRGLTVIQDAEFGVVISLAAVFPELKDYLARNRTYITTNRQYAEKEQGDEYVLIEDTDALPDPIKEEIAYQALMKPDFVLRIFDDKESSDCFWKARQSESIVILMRIPLKLDTHSTANWTVGA